MWLLFNYPCPGNISVILANIYASSFYSSLFLFFITLCILCSRYYHPNFKIKKFNLREVKQFIKNDIAKTWSNQNLDPDLYKVFELPQVFLASLSFPLC